MGTFVKLIHIVQKLIAIDGGFAEYCAYVRICSLLSEISNINSSTIAGWKGLQDQELVRR